MNIGNMLVRTIHKAIYKAIQSDCFYRKRYLFMKFFENLFSVFFVHNLRILWHGECTARDQSLWLCFIYKEATTNKSRINQNLMLFKRSDDATREKKNECYKRYVNTKYIGVFSLPFTIYFCFSNKQPIFAYFLFHFFYLHVENFTYFFLAFLHFFSTI